MSVVLTALITKVIRSDNRHSGARVKRANPESRDSGFAAVHRPGMTETRNAGATVADPQCTCSHAPLSDTPSRSRRGFRARFGLLVPPPSSEGAGNAGRPMRPIAACAVVVVERTRVSQVTPANTRHSPRNGLRLTSCSSRRSGFFVTVISEYLFSPT